MSYVNHSHPQMVRVQDSGMVLVDVTMFEADHYHGQRLHEKETNGECAVSRATREDGTTRPPMNE